MAGSIRVNSPPTHALYYTPSYFATRLVYREIYSSQAINEESFLMPPSLVDSKPQHYALLGTSTFSAFSCAAITRAISISMDL